MTPVDLADEIYEADLDCPLDTSVPKIVFKLLTLVGQLNNKIDTNITVTEADIFTPELDTEQASVLRQIFLVKYYGKKIRDNLGAGGIDWKEIKEADSVVKRATRTELAKLYQVEKDAANKELIRLVGEYKINNAIIRAIDYCE